jgi:hypothetical protein
VKAHQDDKRPYEELDIWGRMNCDADKLAEKFQKLMDKGTVKALKEGFFIDSMEVGISVDGVKVTSHILHQIRLKIQGAKHRKYLQEKYDWDHVTWDSIDWKGIKSGFLSLESRHPKVCMAGLILDIRNQRCCRFSQVSKVS